MKKKYKVENWSEYNESLKSRYSLTIWLKAGFECNWYSKNNSINVCGRPKKSSDSAINLMGFSTGKYGNSLDLICIFAVWEFLVRIYLHCV